MLEAGLQQVKHPYGHTAEPRLLTHYEILQHVTTSDLLSTLEDRHLGQLAPSDFADGFLLHHLR